MNSRPGTIIYTIAALISLAGLADVVYLTVIAYSGVAAACGNVAGCVQVLSSPYAKVAGVPVAAFGVLGYFAVFAFAILTCFGYDRARRFFALTVWLMFLVTLWLLYAQAFILHAFCRYCLLSAAIIFLLAGLAVVSPIPQYDVEAEDEPVNG